MTGIWAVPGPFFSLPNDKKQSDCMTWKTKFFVWHSGSFRISRAFFCCKMCCRDYEYVFSIYCNTCIEQEHYYKYRQGLFTGVCSWLDQHNSRVQYEDPHAKYSITRTTVYAYAFANSFWSVRFPFWVKLFGFKISNLSAIRICFIFYMKFPLKYCS